MKIIVNIIILNGESEGRHISLNPGIYRLGRSSDCDIVLGGDRYISGSHAELKLTENGKVIIRDLGSKNGTFLLGEIVEKQIKVNPGDIVRLGHTFLKISRRSVERFFTSDIEISDKPEAIVVVDIVGSSKIAQALGDRMASKVKNILHDNLKKNLEAHPAEFH